MSLFAVLVITSLATKEAAKRLGMPESRVRQMVARRTLYSVLLNSYWRIPAFQFAQKAVWCRTLPKSTLRCLRTCIPRFAKAIDLGASRMIK